MGWSTGGGLIYVAGACLTFGFGLYQSVSYGLECGFKDWLGWGFMIGCDVLLAIAWPVTWLLALAGWIYERRR